MGTEVRSRLRRLLPPRLLGLLRSVRTQADVRGYRAREVTHTYGGTRTLGGQEGVVTEDVPDGQVARVRIINTDNGAVQAWTSASYRVVAALAVTASNTAGTAASRPVPATRKGFGFMSSHPESRHWAARPRWSG